MAYFSGQGKVFSTDRDVNGNVTAFRFVGNVPMFKVSTKVNFTEHKEAQSGNRLVDARVPKETICNLELTFEDFNVGNLIAALYGDSTADAGTGVVGEALPPGLVQNDFVRLKNGDVSAVVVKDSAAAVKVLNTDYAIESAAHGMLQILAASITNQPWTVNYTYAAQTRVRMLTQNVKERWLRFEGLNTGDPNQAKWLVEMYRVQLDPVKDLNAIGDDMEKLEMTGTCLWDSVKAADPTLGGFGKIVML